MVLGYEVVLNNENEYGETLWQWYIIRGMGDKIKCFSSMLCNHESSDQLQCSLAQILQVSGTVPDG